jgi:ribonuclease Z
MGFDIIFLGTSSMVPTKDRSHSAILVEHAKDNVLMDCGEGTQRQMKIAGVDINRITKILISHWHGDHVLGLGGLIQTMASQQYAGTLKLYGPVGSKKYIENMMKGFSFDNRLDLEVIEISKDGMIADEEDYIIEARELEHSIKCYGFALIEKDKRKINVAVAKKLGIPEGPLLGKLQRGENITLNGKKIAADEATTLIKGKKLSYVADTMPCNGAVTLSKDADLMISESTLATKVEGKAEEYKHMTSRQAGMLANQANAKKLVLTHFSQRYKDTKELEEEAKDVFANVVAAYDFMKIKV